MMKGDFAKPASGAAMFVVCVWGTIHAMAAGVAAPAPQSAAAGQDKTRIEAIVKAIYHPYFGKGRDTPAMGKAAPWTKDMQAHVDAVSHCEQKTGDELIDADPIIQAQDYKLSHLTVDVMESAAGGKATADVRFKNLGEWTSLRYDFVIENGQWKVDNIVSSDKSDLRSELKAAMKEEKC